LPENNMSYFRPAPVALAVLLVACSAAPPEDTIDSNDGALVGGAATNEASHVGRVLRRADDGATPCTGTLVTPQIVVTSKQCFTPFVAAGTEAEASGQVFVIEKNGQRFDYEILRFRTLPQVDVAIALLLREVPGAVAIGAPLATHVPLSGEPVTTYGYGCVDRNTGAGANVKRKATLRFGQTSTKSCPGDEGGPTFDRYGALVQVTSIAGAGGRDRFAAIPPSFVTLTDQMLAWGASPCANANPGITFDPWHTHEAADLCVATTYYCNPYQDLGGPIEHGAPAPGYGPWLADACAYNGWSRDPSLPYMWQQNACKSCDGDCFSECEH